MSALYHRTRALAEIAGIRPSRRLGQSFLVDPEMARRIAGAASVEPTDWILEIGPGLGALSKELVDVGVPVVAVERDLRLLPILAAELGPAVQLIGMDATRLDWQRIGRRPPVLMSNLPYPITSDLLLALCHRPAPVRQAVLLLQREVAQRIAAPASTSERGSLSVLVQVCFHVQIALEVGPECFWPRPEVHSSLVRLDPHSAGVALPQGFRPLLLRGFGQRRKTLYNALGRPAGLLERAGLPPQIRAQDLSNEQWLALASLMSGSSAPI